MNYRTICINKEKEYYYLISKIRGENLTHVFIIGSKGIPANYGGFETFVEHLTSEKKNQKIKYHVSCMSNEEKHFEYNNADCFNVRVPLPGAPGRILHMGLVLKEVEKWVRNNNTNNSVIIYILGCRIGPLLIPFAKRFKKYGIKILCNPDGLEWKRSKWNSIEKKFLKYCEKCLIENSDLVICDSENIQKYVQFTYPQKILTTKFLAYGASVLKSDCSKVKLIEWNNKYNVSINEYYLIVGRFVPENNYATIISEFIKSNTTKDLVIITNYENNKFYKKLNNITKLKDDSRIKFVGTVYDQELLKKIRENAFAYIHGHEVGGTNPSLLEALASTKINLLLDVGFNSEVAVDTALYWTKQNNNLSSLIEYCDNSLSENERNQLGEKSTQRIKSSYNWSIICNNYERLFLTSFDN